MLLHTYAASTKNWLDCSETCRFQLSPVHFHRQEPPTNYQQCKRRRQRIVHFFLFVFFLLRQQSARSFLEGYRRAEVRRVARETTTVLLDKVTEGIEGLDFLRASMTKTSDDTGDVGELNDALLDYLNDSIRQQEKKVEQQTWRSKPKLALYTQQSIHTTISMNNAK